MNGGLFERDSLDELQVRFPKEYFADLFDLFDQYNFTIDENDPNDAVVGVDPEMLGLIFENLLEDNKDKGAFYTPKKIVQFMCIFLPKRYCLPPRLFIAIISLCLTCFALGYNLGSKSNE